VADRVEAAEVRETQQKRRRPLPPLEECPPLSRPRLTWHASGLCFFHWTFSDKATKCVDPCTWGN
jgi:hypothetical protein